MKVEDLVPIGTNVLILADDQSRVLPSGIVIPDTVSLDKDNPARTGTVVAIGGRYNQESGDELVVGDRVAFQVIGTKKLEYEGSEYFLVRDVHNPRGVLARIVESSSSTD